MLYETLQQLLRTGQLTPPELDNRNRQLFHLPSVMVQREAFIADRVAFVDRAQWDDARRAQRLQRQLEG
jgi:hypothetical protein